MMKLIVRAPSLAIRVTVQVMMNFLKGCWLQNPADTRKVMYMLLLCPALVTTEFAFFFSCWIFQGNCKIDSYDTSEALVIKELLLFFIMMKQLTFFIVLFTLLCEAWFLNSDNRHSLLWKAFYFLILFPIISHIIS